jgi:hypothetical protein
MLFILCIVVYVQTFGTIWINKENLNKFWREFYWYDIAVTLFSTILFCCQINNVSNNVQLKDDKTVCM